MLSLALASLNLDFLVDEASLHVPSPLFGPTLGSARLGQALHAPSSSCSTTSLWAQPRALSLSPPAYAQWGSMLLPETLPVVPPGPPPPLEPSPSFRLPPPCLPLPPQPLDGALGGGPQRDRAQSRPAHPPVMPALPAGAFVRPPSAPPGRPLHPPLPPGPPPSQAAPAPPRGPPPPPRAPPPPPGPPPPSARPPPPPTSPHPRTLSPASPASPASPSHHPHSRPHRRTARGPRYPGVPFVPVLLSYPPPPHHFGRAMPTAQT
jgi:hypothetical protein